MPDQRKIWFLQGVPDLLPRGIVGLLDVQRYQAACVASHHARTCRRRAQKIKSQSEFQVLIDLRLDGCADGKHLRDQPSLSFLNRCPITGLSASPIRDRAIQPTASAIRQLILDRQQPIAPCQRLEISSAPIDQRGHVLVRPSPCALVRSDLQRRDSSKQRIITEWRAATATITAIKEDRPAAPAQAGAATAPEVLRPPRIRHLLQTLFGGGPHSGVPVRMSAA
jgi:hypothetical protein